MAHRKGTKAVVFLVKPKRFWVKNIKERKREGGVERERESNHVHALFGSEV